jgi:hypothetical protein
MKKLLEYRTDISSARSFSSLERQMVMGRWNEVGKTVQA